MNQVNQTARPTRIAAWDLLKLFAIFFSGIWSLYATSFGGRYQI